MITFIIDSSVNYDEEKNCLVYKVKNTRHNFLKPKEMKCLIQSKNQRRFCLFSHSEKTQANPYFWKTEPDNAWCFALKYDSNK